MDKYSKVVVDAMKAEGKTDLAKEWFEVAAGIVFDSKVLEELPIVKSLMAVYKAFGTIRDQLLIKKITSFLHSLSEVSKDDRTEMLKKLNDDANFSNKAGEWIIEILDRMESDKKPDLAAKCFVAYAREEISYLIFRRILFALEKIPSFDIDKLEDFMKEKLNKENESILLAFVNSGLGKNNGGMDGGCILPTELCGTFVKVCINRDL